MRVAVIGYGICGSFAALWANELGFDVTVFEKDPIPHQSATSIHAAGMLTPVSESFVRSETFAKLLMESLKQWKNIPWKCLRKKVYISGTMLLANEQNKHTLDNFLKEISAENRQHIRKEQVNDKDHFTTRIKYKAFNDLEGYVIPREILLSIHQKLAMDDVTFKFSSAIDKQTINQLSYDFDYVIDTRGLGAKDTLPSLRPVTGEYVRLKAQNINLKTTVRYLDERTSGYLVPHGDELYLGATETEHNPDGSVSVDSIMKQIITLGNIFTNFRDFRILEVNSAARPTMPNSKPHIELKKNIITINGLYRHGILLSPYITKEIMHHVRGDRFSEFIKPFISQTK